MNFTNLIQNCGETQRVPAGTMLFSIYDRCDHYVLVLDGQVRVELSSITGQQLTLYRIYAGQTCVLTTACLLSGENYSAQAVAETDVDIVLMPKSEFDRMLAESAGFRQFVFDGFSERLSTMLQRTSELATYSIDQRLAAALLAHCEWQADPILNVTHEALAVEIGTAREVVSRRLGIFEKDGLLRRHRKYLEILDETGLRQKLAN